MFLLLWMACLGSVDCEKLSTEACAKQAQCSLVVGRKAIPGDDCVTLDRSEPIGCTAVVHESCGFTQGFSGPGDGTCYRLATACQPPGWTSCGLDTGDVCR